jgi:hypothetical protein
VDMETSKSPAVSPTTVAIGGMGCTAVVTCGRVD